MKRLMCFFDGTWNKPDSKDETTNIVKLHRHVPPAGTDGVAQLAHYEIGIATKENFGRLTFAAGAIGIGIADRIQSGYKFLVENYEPGDEIYLFGFSRGAFQARSLAGLITRVGILKSQATSRVTEAWDAYQALQADPSGSARAEIADALHPPARIRCIGVWDTVGNLGVPYLKGGRINSALQFHSTTLSPQVDVALHALSIDEPRGAFSPTLWTKPAKSALPAGQIVEQVWFAGCHANVGGGYKDSTLSDISLLWMAKRVMTATGATFDLENLERECNPDPLGEAVAPTSDAIFRVSQVLPFVRLIALDQRGIPPLRRAIVGSWRSTRVVPGEEIVNEAIHESAVARFGRVVKVRRGDVVTTKLYKPRTLKLALLKTRRRML